MTHVYGTFAVAVIFAIGAFFIVDSYTEVPSAWLTALWGSAAINLFYWYQARPLSSAAQEITTLHASIIAWPLRGAVFLATALWLQRTISIHAVFVDRRHSARRRHTRGLIGSP